MGIESLQPFAVPVAVVCAVIIVFVLIMWGFQKVGTRVRAPECAGDACLVQPTRAFADKPAPSPLRMSTELGSRSTTAVFNASLALVPRPKSGSASASGSGSGSGSAFASSTRHEDNFAVSTSRISSYTFCPGTRIYDLYLAPPMVGGVNVVVDGDPRFFVIPKAWWTPEANDAWTTNHPGLKRAFARTPRLQDTLLEDPRPFALAPGVLGVICVVFDVASSTRQRMAVLVARLPLQSRAPGSVDDACEPDAIVLLKDSESQVQKNWLPIVHGASVFFYKHTVPHQLLLEVPLATFLHARGAVVAAPRVFHDAPVDRVALTLSHKSQTWRGSSQIIPLVPSAPERGLVCVLHARALSSSLYDLVFTRHRNLTQLRYSQVLALFESTPPFRVQRISRVFVFDVIKTPSGDDGEFVYISGLCAEPHVPDSFLMSYGVDDCYEGVLRVSRAQMDALFMAGPNAAPMRCELHMSADARDVPGQLTEIKPKLYAA